MSNINYEDIIEYFILINKDILGFSTNIKYEIEFVDVRQLSSVAKVRFFDSIMSKVFFLKTSKDQNFIMWGGCLKSEYEILKLIKKDGNYNKILNVPNPIAFIPEKDTLITEGIFAEDANAIINSAIKYNIFSDKRVISKSVVLNSGRWLRNFHTFTGLERGGFDFSPSIRWIKVRLELLKKDNAKGIDDVFCQKIVNKLVKLKKEIDKDSVILSGSHGDFCPHNILAHTDNSVSVIDFAAYSKGPIYYDILRFYNELDNQGYYFGSSYFYKTLQEDFLSSYGIKIELNSPLTQFILCQYKVAKMLNAHYLGLDWTKLFVNGVFPYYKNLSWLKTIFLKEN